MVVVVIASLSSITYLYLGLRLCALILNTTYHVFEIIPPSSHWLLLVNR